MLLCVLLICFCPFQKRIEGKGVITYRSPISTHKQEDFEEKEKQQNSSVWYIFPIFPDSKSYVWFI